MAHIKQLVRGLAYWVRYASRRLQRKPVPFKTLIVDDQPDICNRNVLYLLGVNQRPWAAVFERPCGCGSQIQLNLLSEGSPCWQVKQHWDSTITLYPSVFRKVGCRSHFWIRNGLLLGLEEEKSNVSKNHMP